MGWNAYWNRGSVLVDVIDVGRGHRRILPVIEELYNDGCNLIYLGNPSILDENEKEYFTSIHPMTSFLRIENDDSLRPKTNLCRLAPEIVKNVAIDRSKEYIICNPRIVIVDNDHSKLFPGKFRKYVKNLFKIDRSRCAPGVIFVTNQLVLDCNIPWLTPLERLITYKHGLFTNIEFVLDMPNKYEKFSIDPRAFIVAEHDKKIKFVGQPHPKKPDYVPETVEEVRLYLEKTHKKELPQMEGKIPILCSVTDNQIREVSKHAAKELNKRGYIPIISNTQSSDSEDYVTISNNEDYRSILFSPTIKTIVIRGGHTSISWAGYCGKRMVLIPIRGHPEQIRNAKRVDEGIGTGKYLPIEEVQKNPSVFADAIVSVDNDEAMKKRAEQWSAVSNRPKNDYVKNCVEATKELYEEILW